MPLLLNNGLRICNGLRTGTSDQACTCTPPDLEKPPTCKTCGGCCMTTTATLTLSWSVEKGGLVSENPGGLGDPSGPIPAALAAGSIELAIVTEPWPDDGSLPNVHRTGCAFTPSGSWTEEPGVPFVKFSSGQHNGDPRGTCVDAYILPFVSFHPQPESGGAVFVEGPNYNERWCSLRMFGCSTEGSCCGITDMPIVEGEGGLLNSSVIAVQFFDKDTGAFVGTTILGLTGTLSVTIAENGNCSRDNCGHCRPIAEDTCDHAEVTPYTLVEATWGIVPSTGVCGWTTRTISLTDESPTQDGWVQQENPCKYRKRYCPGAAPSPGDLPPTPPPGCDVDCPGEEGNPCENACEDLEDSYLVEFDYELWECIGGEWQLVCTDHVSKIVTGGCGEGEELNLWAGDGDATCSLDYVQLQLICTGEGESVPQFQLETAGLGGTNQTMRNADTPVGSWGNGVFNNATPPGSCVFPQQYTDRLTNIVIS